LLIHPGTAHAETRLADIFLDGAILQRQAPVPVWGWAEPGAKVEVSFGGQTRSATADDKGYWKVTLDPLEASNEGRELVLQSGSEKQVVKNVRVGEVWLVSGQSNMRAGGPDRDTGVYPFYQSKSGNGPEIRVREFGSGASLEPEADEPLNRGKNPWEPMPDLVPNKEYPLAYYFARILRDQLQVPVGLIMVAVPGTNQAAWMAKETLESFPAAGGGGANFYESFLAEKESALAKGKTPFKSWAEFKELEKTWLENPSGLWPGRGQLVLANYPTALYNTRIYPLAPYAFRGVLWHQGEAGPGGAYGQRLVAMFKQWRTLFGHDFPVIWGTLSKNTASQPPLEPALETFYRSGTNVEIRRALELFQGDKGAEFVEFYDLGNDDTHFTQKAEAGRRMALAALAKVYDKPQLYTAPRLAESKLEGGRAILRFDHVGTALAYEPGINGISGVIVSGSDGRGRWANVKVIDAQTIECSHPEVADVKFVAYGGSPNPHETLFSSEGLPAGPFAVNSGSVKLENAKAPYSILKIEGGNDAKLHLEHVRREGYVFEIRKNKAAGEKVTVQAYVPEEWKGAEVTADGQAVATESVTADGASFVRFEAAVNGPRVIVAKPGKAGEFQKVDRY